MKFVECPRCGEITLEYKSVTDTKPYIETWECECGHTECFHVTAPQTPKRTQFNDWLHTVNFDKIDAMGKVEAMRIAYYAGISAQQDMEIARLNKDISLLKRQAE